jgi:hypothetical protein
MLGKVFKLAQKAKVIRKAEDEGEMNMGAMSSDTKGERLCASMRSMLEEINPARKRM